MHKPTIISVLLVLAVLVVGTGIYLCMRREPALTDRIVLSGVVEVTQVETSFKVPGRVIDRLVDEGETVTLGQPLARLDRTDLEHEENQRATAVEALRAQLAELQAGSRREEIAQADAVVARVRAEAERQRADYARQEALYALEVISRRDFDAARAVRDMTGATLREATEQAALVHKGPRQERIDAARARLKEGEAALASARARLSYTTLTSPLTGLVLSKNVEPGEMVATGTSVLTIGNLADTWVRAYIAETDLGRVQVGQQATVNTDTHPGRDYRGRVSFISSEAEFTPRQVQTKTERVKLVYRIKISVPNPQLELKPGMPVDAEIVVR